MATAILMQSNQISDLYKKFIIDIKMSLQHPNSSTVIFEYEQNEKQKQQLSGTTNSNSNSNKIHNVKDEQENSPVQISTSIIKVNSTPRIRYRGKISVSRTGQMVEQSQKKKRKKLVFEQLDESEDHHADDKKSETSSNKQTKPTKTIEQEQIEDTAYKIQKPYSEQNEDFEIQLYARHKTDAKLEQKAQPQSVIPCNAKRQLGNSDEEQIKEKEEEQEQDSEEQKDKCEYDYDYNYVQKSKLSPSHLTKPRKQPSISVAFTSEQLQTFLHTPINHVYQFECIVQVQSGFFNIGNRYNLKQKYENKVLISAKKQLMSFNPKIILSMDKDNHSRRHRDFLGILEGNFSGTQWNLSCPVIPNRYNEGEVCQEMRDLLVAKYGTSVMGSKSLRQMRAYILDAGLPKEKRKTLSLTRELQKTKSRKIAELETGKPSLVKGRYILDFKGLAKVPSSKNFIMLTKQGKQCLIFAKQSQDIYAMNIRYPLSLAQGFSLCLASLNSKLLVN